MHVIVAESMADAVRERVKTLDLPVEILVADADGALSEAGDEAEVYFRAFQGGAAYRRVLADAPRLRWVHTGSAGVDGLLTDDLHARGITLTNSAGVHAIPIAEWVLYALLAIVKRGPQMLAAQHERRWDEDTSYDELGGKTLTVLGAGGIGQEVARRAAAFDMRCWGVNRSGRNVSGFERIVTNERWMDLLPETDMLVVAAPLTDETRHMVDAAALQRLPDQAWLINVARGALVDEAALISALRDGVIAGAALDTVEQEPLPADSPLWTMPNVLISPHRSGSSPRSRTRVVERFVENLRRFVAGEPLISVVDVEAGY